MKGQQPLMSSNKQDWGTPQAFIWWLEHRYQFKFDLDVCAHSGNNKVPAFFTVDDDCLISDWFGRNVWMNPPFGRELPKFINRALEQVAINKGKMNCWILVPARTCTKWAHKLFNSKELVKIIFFKGRFNFDFERNIGGFNAPFPSMLIQIRGFKSPTQRREPKISFVEVPKEARGFK